ncbi:hypothetical protein CXB51_025133 [Gossypium anomalum]|uniref:DUF7745 domain-containing protein n=1 Tax=Gossypium anomalum TaxID=47600 RepID=A0A8J6CRK6_9ROSI|nr:hypothetical protein CXB51_025133 [Gossypium anomalum]
MGNGYLDKVEDNASVYTWSNKTQLEKGDSVTEGHTSELWDFTHINSTQKNTKVDKHLFRAMIQGNKAYVRPASLPNFTKKLVMITGMSEQLAVARVQQKDDSKCVPWAVLRDLISTHPDVKKRIDVLALSIYGLVIFPKALGHIDEALADLFNQLAETFRSLSSCRRAGEGGRFIGCTQLLLVWFHSHFWKVDKVPCRVFFKDYFPLKEAIDMPRRDDISEERWIDILQNLREEVMWKAPWLVPSEVLYSCGNFDGSLCQKLESCWICTIACSKAISNEAVHTGYTGFSSELDINLQYKGWFSRGVNNNVPRPILGVARSLEESLRVIPSELEVMKQEFERKNSELENRIEKLEEEKMYLSLDVDVQKMEVERRVRLGRSSEQWQQEIQEEMIKTEYWEKKFQEMQSRNQALEKENQGLKTKVAELGRSLHHHQSHNSAIELKARLDKIEEMKYNIGGLEAALQDCELRIEQLEAREK